MNDNLFIPNKIKVGYVNRSDTYSKKLAYIIYYDSKGKLRKETSFESWRDKKIPTNEFENKPQSGFIINKDIRRIHEYFGSGRTMIRVYDGRGIEFEITCDNLIFILMNTNCNKRELEGEFVYAWYGKDLMLLPVGCEEYKQSQKFTKLQTGKVNSKSLVPGCMYATKSTEELLYLGKFKYYKTDCDYVTRFYNMEDIGLHFIFLNKNNQVINLKSVSSIAAQLSDIPITDYAEKLEIFSKSMNASLPKEFVVEKISEITFPEVDVACADDNYYFFYEEKNDNCIFLKTKNNLFEAYKPRNFYKSLNKIAENKDKFLEIHNHSPQAVKYVSTIESNPNDEDEDDIEYQLTDIPIYKLGYQYLEFLGGCFDIENNKPVALDDSIRNACYYDKKNVKNLTKLNTSEIYRIYVITENGGKLPLGNYIF